MNGTVRGLIVQQQQARTHRGVVGYFRGIISFDRAENSQTCTSAKGANGSVTLQRIANPKGSPTFEAEISDVARDMNYSQFVLDLPVSTPRGQGLNTWFRVARVLHPTGKNPKWSKLCGRQRQANQSSVARSNANEKGRDSLTTSTNGCGNHLSR